MSGETASESKSQRADPVDADVFWFLAAGIVVVVPTVGTFIAMQHWRDHIDKRNAAAGLNIERYPLLALQPWVTAALVSLFILGIIRLYVFIIRLESQAK